MLHSAGMATGKVYSVTAIHSQWMVTNDPQFTIHVLHHLLQSKDADCP
jgi:hypothetical protein